ncbi:Crp/Fnr family transcriptional regulator [Methylovirgula sp. 4M-Z18]|uniref:Crp/Fnr family transcriptional regulator n=1 Tax=Methylovirgula sp. 4M-Z18 TaxID=2293567 RepID=UPI001314BFE6|nr:cyclic nucleotide-binding domain-containing protein [Methylovirgula sp. 4M-Z18]
MALDLFNYSNPRANVLTDDNTILSHFSDAEWTELLKVMERRRFAPGTLILEAGSSDRTLYIIAAGDVDVVATTTAGVQHLAVIGEGSVFGEMAFFDGGPRSADILARGEVEVLALQQDRFEQLVAWHPRIATKLLMDLGRVLSRRLRHVNQLV